MSEAKSHTLHTLYPFELPSSEKRDLVEAHPLAEPG